MKEHTLSKEEIAELEKLHRSLRDKRQADRVEPRAVKRRPKEYALLNRPRHEMRIALLRA